MDQVMGSKGLVLRNRPHLSPRLLAAPLLLAPRRAPVRLLARVPVSDHGDRAQACCQVVLGMNLPIPPGWNTLQKRRQRWRSAQQRALLPSRAREGDGDEGGDAAGKHTKQQAVAHQGTQRRARDAPPGERR